MLKAELRGGGTTSASLSRKSNGENSITPLALAAWTFACDPGRPSWRLCAVAASTGLA